MNSVTITAKNVDDAIKKALEKLNITQDDAEVTVLQEASKGFLGIFGSKEAIVKVDEKVNPGKVAEVFLKEMFLAMGLVVKIQTKLQDKNLLIDISGENMGILIGKRGQTLDSIQYLTNLVVNKGKSPYVSITIDTENYRKRRKDTLESLAINLAKKVKQTGRSVFLEPMNPYERRIIHAVLQNDKYVKTYSEGDEPFRNVVIATK